MNNTVIESYQPNAKQAAFHADPAKFRAAIGAWGCGKTTVAIWEDIALAMEYPGSVGLSARATYPALRDTIKKDYLSIIPSELVKREIRTPGREEIEFINGSRTWFRCLDDARKYGSTQFDRVMIHEAEEVGEDVFRTLAFGRLRGTVGPRRLIVESNPPDEDHWLYKFFVEHATDDTAVHHFSTYDNAANLPDGYIAKLEQMPTQWKRKYLFGLWGVIAKGAGVFDADFNEERHVDSLTPNRDGLLIRGWDFGFRRPCCVWVQIDAKGTLHVLHEMLGENIPLRQFAEQVLEQTDKRFGRRIQVEDYCDVAGNQRNDRGPTACQILADEFKLSPMTRKMGINQGLEAIRWLLSNDQFRIDKGCRWGVKAFGGGYYVDPKTGEPAKDGTYDNWMDAFRYAAVPKILPGYTRWQEGVRLEIAWRKAV